MRANATGRNVRVQFYLYNQLLGEDNEAPFYDGMDPSREGTAVIRAVAVDNRGLTAKDSRDGERHIRLLLHGQTRAERRLLKR